MTRRPEAGRAVFYFRDSGGQHETTPGQYVTAAARFSQQHGLEFSGTSDQIKKMIDSGVAVEGDIFLDYGVTGNTLSRTALNALFEKVRCNPNISHVIIPRRDRLARPEDPWDGVQLERRLRLMGVHVVIGQQVLGPIRRGRMSDLGDELTTYLGYRQSRQDVVTMAERTIFSQVERALGGFANGGRPPYGAKRYLVRLDGSNPEELRAGDEVGRAGHRIRWLLTDEPKLRIVDRIYDMLESGMPAARVAAALNAEGIPAPDTGRHRRDNKRLHLTSGLWRQTTVVSIARNPIYCGSVCHGRRSLGYIYRFTPKGPRELDEQEFVTGADQDASADDKPKVKVVRNGESQVITAKGAIPARISPERWERINRMLDERAGRQRGKPRSRNPAANPLGCRVFDLACAWPMYREPYGKSFRHVCGMYHESHGTRCHHNWIHGPTAVRFVLHQIKDHLLAPARLARIQAEIMTIAEREMTAPGNEQRIQTLESERDELQRSLDRASRNMTLAESREEFEAMRKTFREIEASKRRVEQQLQAETQKRSTTDIDAEVAAAMSTLEHLEELADDPENLLAVGELIKAVNVNLFLDFEHADWGKRKVRRVSGGVLTTGLAPLPIEPYRGCTSRKEDTRKTSGNLRTSEEGGSNTSPPSMVTGRKADSLRNVGRGGGI